jgi:hypothetical protein
VSTATAIAAIRTSHGIELRSHEMLTSGTTMTAFTKYPDLINEIRFFHGCARYKIE